MLRTYKTLNGIKEYMGVPNRRCENILYCGGAYQALQDENARNADCTEIGTPRRGSFSPPVAMCCIRFLAFDIHADSGLQPPLWVGSAAASRGAAVTFLEGSIIRGRGR